MRAKPLQRRVAMVPASAGPAAQPGSKSARPAPCEVDPRRESAPRGTFGTKSAGWSLVEVLVGLTIGLLLTAAASGWSLGSVRAGSRMIATARLATDVQTAAGLMAADLRRAGFWGDAASAVQSVANGASAPGNPYTALAPAAAASDGVAYAYSRDAVENNRVDGNETVGHRLRGGVLETALGGGGWQALTDPAALRVMGFSVEPLASTVPLGDLCAAPCPASAADCPPTLVVRSVRVTVMGRSVLDANAAQSASTTSRLRSDAVVGRCPG